MAKEIRLITAALPYTNNVPHLGNIAGSHLPADIFARFSRLMGHDTLFVGGTDEHGTTSEIAAQKYNITPKQLCDFFYKIHNEIYKWLDISYNNFSRTSREIHHKTTIDLLKKVKQNGYILEQKIKVPYCRNCRRELADRYIEGKCPNCSYERARGDQCEACSSLLESTKLIDPYCAVCKSQDISFEDKQHLFLDLKKLSLKIEKWIRNNKQMRMQVKNLALSWINEGLKPRCITRNLNWGVQVPFKGYEHLRFYVWVDAPIGYISSTKEASKKWKGYWQNPKAKIYHFLGKDNIPFHTIFWPGLLIANGEFNLPYNVIGLQYLNYEGGKFSKSQSRGIFCENLPLAGLHSDCWRFYLSFLIPETKDTEFYWSEFKERVNSELVGNFSNFIHRTLSFIEKNYGCSIPSPLLSKEDREFIKSAEKRVKEIIAAIENISLREGLEGILALSASANKYLQENEPWKNKEHAPAVMYVCANICEILSLLINPYLPATSLRIRQILNLDNPLSLKNAGKFRLKAGHKTLKPVPLFIPLTDGQIQELKEKTAKVTEYFKEGQSKDGEIKGETNTKIETKTEGKKKGEKNMASKTNQFNLARQTAKPTAEESAEQGSAETKLIELCQGCKYIPFELWKSMHLHIGRIEKIEQHPNADKLYVMLIDLGPGENKRQIVAGLKEHYKMEELLNKKIVLFTNLQPALIRGIESNGMLLAAEFRGKITLIVPEDKDFQTGARVV